MRKIATVEARMSSSRLPGKVLLPLYGKPALERLVERARRSKKIEDVVLATTVSPKDDALADWAKKAGVSVFRGSEEDVLLRVLEAAKAFGGEVIVELTGDCPLLDPAHIDELVAMITVQRSFESAAALMQKIDETYRHKEEEIMQV